MTDERAMLKTEQLERIKQRDTFLNLNIVALGVVTAIAVQGQKQAAAWLVVPWLTAIMGWAYLSNDDKVTAIARHLKATRDTQAAALSWEAGQKGLLPSWVRRLAEVVVFLLSFVLPTPVAITLYATTSLATWPVVVLIVVIFEAMITASLCAIYVLSTIRRR
jgi:hypothetical protein